MKNNQYVMWVIKFFLKLVISETLSKMWKKVLPGPDQAFAATCLPQTTAILALSTAMCYLPWPFWHLPRPHPQYNNTLFHAGSSLSDMQWYSKNDPKKIQH
jgi:hypothetical protein